MTFQEFTTLPLNFTPTTSNINDYVGRRVDWFGNGSGGTLQNSVKVDTAGASDMSTDSDGLGFGCTGNATKDYWGDGLDVNRYGQKGGRAVVRIGHMYSSSGGNPTRYLPENTQGCHLRNAVGVAMVYNNNIASEQKYAANLQRICLLYAMPDKFSGDKHASYVYEAVQKCSTSQSLKANLSNGDKIYSYVLSNTDQNVVVSNNMTLEGVFLEFKVNQAPGCCKNKDCAARVWRMTPIITNQHSTLIASSAPSFLNIPFKNTSTIDNANSTGLRELSQG